MIFTISEDNILSLIHVQSLGVNFFQNFDSSSCGSLNNAEGPVIIGNPISVDDWVPELPPKKAHLRNACPPRRLASPDLPPPSPPPVVEDEVFFSDEPLPPPPPEILTDSSLKEKESSDRSAFLNGAPDIILSSTTASLLTESVANECQNGVRSRADCERPMKKNITNEPKNNEPTFPRNPRDKEFYRYSQHLFKEELATAEYRHQVEPSDVKATPVLKVAVEGGRMQSADFLNKRSVFANGYPERLSMRYSSGRKVPANSKIASVRGTPNPKDVEVSRAAKYDPSIDGVDAKKPVFSTDVSKNPQQQFSSVVLRHSEKFPTKLDPQCPRTTYQLYV